MEKIRSSLSSIDPFRGLPPAEMDRLASISQEIKQRTIIGHWAPMMGLLLFSAFAFPRAIQAGQAVLKPESRVWLTGDSTLHPYASTATVIDLQADFQPLGAASSVGETLSQSEVQTFKVTIPVTGLKSGEKGLDKNLYKALKEDTSPSIQFQLSDKRLLSGLPAAGIHQLTSNGVLTIAGKENAIQIDSQFELLPTGIHIFGTKNLLMTDYGVKPPTILAFIKVKNEVTVHFDLILDFAGQQK